MFERYTETARRALFFARYEASQLGSITIETEHLLLGLVREGAVLKGLLPMPLDRLRRDIEARVPFQKRISTSVEIPFSAETKRALQFAAQEADALGHAHIGSEHLLLGLLREEHSGAASTLAAHGAQLDDIRKQVASLPQPLEGEPQKLAGLQIDRIKGLVEELASTAPVTPAAQDLVSRIKAALDALLKDTLD
jgi:ATP-dependent Clp protease ATP-binding subunit ClpC